MLLITVKKVTEIRKRTFILARTCILVQGCTSWGQDGHTKIRKHTFILAITPIPAPGHVSQHWDTCPGTNKCAFSDFGSMYLVLCIHGMYSVFTSPSSAQSSLCFIFLFNIYVFVSGHSMLSVLFIIIEQYSYSKLFCLTISITYMSCHPG